MTSSIVASEVMSSGEDTTMEFLGKEKRSGDNSSLSSQSVRLSMANVTSFTIFLLSLCRFLFALVEL